MLYPSLVSVDGLTPWSNSTSACLLRLEAPAGHLTSDMAQQLLWIFPEEILSFIINIPKPKKLSSGRDDGSIFKLHAQSAKECCFFLDLVSTQKVNLLDPVSQGSGSSGALGHNLEETLSL